MHNEEEIKDNRYFPSKEEQLILTQAIDKYFSLPERSEERAIIVKSVTGQLTQINTRWTNRAVRLWFNNNKRTFLRTSNQYDPTKARKDFSLPTDKMPPVKRPPHSVSVGSFLSRPLSPLMEYSISDSLENIYTAAVQQHQNLDSKKRIESDLTDLLICSSDKFWLENVAPIDQIHSITAQETMSTSKSHNTYPTNPNFTILSMYSNVETGILRYGVPYLIDFDSELQNHFLQIGPQRTEIQIPFRATSIEHDYITNTLFVVSGNQITEVSINDQTITPFKYVIDCPPILRSSIVKWNNQLLVGSRRQLYLWNYQNLTEPINNGYEVCVNISLPSITSLVQVGELLAISSRNHHSIHLINSQLQPALCLIGHAAGITSLAQHSNVTFLSGSVDLTARLWDIRFNLPVKQIQRHLAPLTVVSAFQSDSHSYVFTGGEDHYVRVWDLRAERMLCEYNIGKGVPIAIDYNQMNNSIVVLTREKNCTTGQCYGNLINEENSNLLETNPNLCIQFKLV
ncbi:hypothetical protein GPJ56_002798 [Histomonas meleagridis]|uniref:uncharacterized protein n=1 Tax=Histomonas meleagridis TaxID=135588 RepID=UPI00355994D9|nr:hypothetical protein GPJ56_002798 [Histomonas meleagridis]KAH0806314.1 hypothetical protein GO595_001002 [Histomonas meleagridis]